MKRMYGYIRVSTTKQGDGVSLEEQKLAIVRYAKDNDLNIIEWFEETSSASKRGRQAFNEMLRKVKRGSADGLIIHKIDRGSRNIKDWSDISQLSDQGIDVRFAHDNVDLKSRSSRLLADMQAVIAIDYSRNLSEETKKGIYGRLRQGLYPFHAPVGYLNTGQGALKEIDLTKAPLVVKMFELYASGDYSQKRLKNKMNELGLTNTRGNPLCKNNVFRMLHNPFYMGVIKISTTGETFEGRHKPLITSDLFISVQERLERKANPKRREHTPTYKGMITCALCQHVMTGERQKGNYYYRCHQKGCETKTIREDVITRSLSNEFSSLILDESLHDSAFKLIDEFSHESVTESKTLRQSAQLLKGKIQTKISKLADYLVDGVITKDVYVEKQERLHIELKKEQEKLERIDAESKSINAYLKNICELWFSPKLRDFERLGEKKREFTRLLTSNLSVNRRKPIVQLKKPFEALQKVLAGLDCCHLGSTTRIMTGKNTICVHKQCQRKAFKKIYQELVKNYYEDGEAI